MKQTKRQYELDYKRRLVAEYVSGAIGAAALAAREGLVRGQIYKWRAQFDQRARVERVETMVDETGVTVAQARRVRELEEELAATRELLAQTVLENTLLKKMQPNSPFANKSSGYIETKQLLARSRGRAP